MADDRRLAGVVGLFDRAEDLLAAARQVRDAGYECWDCHTPYPVHGLSEAMGLKRSPMGYITISAAVLGAASALLMQGWMSAIDFPVLIGGKPLFSWQAFIPITFELFVLFAALATTAGVIVLCRLWRWHSPLHDSGVMHQVVARRFALVLEAEDKRFEDHAARLLLEGAGCRDIRDLWDTGGDGRIL